VERLLIAIFSLVPALIVCLLEFRVTIGILRLLSRPGKVIPDNLATECHILVVSLPAVGTGVLLLLLPVSTFNYTWLDPLFNPFSIAIALSALLSNSVWLHVVLAKPWRLYAESSAFVPLVVNAMIYLTFAAISAAFSIGLVLGSLPASDTARMVSSANFASVLIFAPLAVFVNMVLLIIHVARTRAFRRREAAGQMPTEAENAD